MSLSVLHAWLINVSVFLQNIHCSSMKTFKRLFNRPLKIFFRSPSCQSDCEECFCLSGVTPYRSEPSGWGPDIGCKSDHQECFRHSGVTPYRPCKILCGLVYCFDVLILILLRGNKLWFLFLPFIPSFGRATSFVPDSILYPYVLLSPREDVPHPGDFVLH